MMPTRPENHRLDQVRGRQVLLARGLTDPRPSNARMPLNKLCRKTSQEAEPNDFIISILVK